MVNTKILNVPIYYNQFNLVCCMLLRQQGMQGHEIGATLLATFVSELKKSYTLCHFITKYFLLQIIEIVGLSGLSPFDI